MIRKDNKELLRVKVTQKSKNLGFAWKEQANLEN
jgi:hypothetical protein